jgi:hypothetical protein
MYWVMELVQTYRTIQGEGHGQGVKLQLKVRFPFKFALHLK